MPYEFFRDIPEDDDSEEDPDFKTVDPSLYCVPHEVYKFEVTKSTTGAEAIEQVLDKANATRKRQILPENLVLCTVEDGEIQEEFSNDMKLEDIDTDGTRYGAKKTVVLLEKRAKKAASADEKIIELNFSRVTLGKRGNIQQTVISAPSAMPRLQTFLPSDTMLDIKKKIHARLEHCWSRDKMPKDGSDEDQKKWLNEAILVYIKDNVQSERRGAYGKKPACEFCTRKHNARDDICEPTAGKLVGNKLEDVDKVTLEMLYK